LEAREYAGVWCASRGQSGLTGLAAEP
jgi:hypothetical protein